jgi:hypothetical protein
MIANKFFAKIALNQLLFLVFIVEIQKKAKAAWGCYLSL